MYPSSPPTVAAARPGTCGSKSAEEQKSPVCLVPIGYLDLARPSSAWGAAIVPAAPAWAASTCSGQIAGVSAYAGSGQVSKVNTAFSLPLQAEVVDTGGCPVASANVEFVAPVSGAGGTSRRGHHGHRSHGRHRRRHCPDDYGQRSNGACSLWKLPYPITRLVSSSQTQPSAPSVP